jgi:Protein of unknown function (DUF2971)
VKNSPASIRSSPKSHNLCDEVLDKDHLVTLLAKRTVKLSRPDAFNDPWDCRVHFIVPRDQQGLKRLKRWLADPEKFPKVARPERRRHAREFVSKTATLQANFLKMEEKMYEGLCELYRVYCLSEICDSPLMWAHYTGKHTGICLEFNADVAPFTRQTGATKVIYQKTYPAFDFIAPGHKALITKSDVWCYEAEWRIVAEERAVAKERGVAQPAGTITTDNGFLELPPGVLKSIIIGCLASKESRQLVASLVRTHAPDVLVRQAASAPDRYDLVIAPPVA